MSFGAISLILNKCIDILNNTNQLKSIDLLQLTKLKKTIYDNIKKEIPEITPEIIDEVFNRLFSKKYRYNKSISFDNGINCFREFENIYPDIKIPSKYKSLLAHFNKLKDLPQPAQRSIEWYNYRYNRITASDMAAAIDMNPYEPVESFILKKCDPNFPFQDNATVFHGKKYEPTATMIYEHIYNTRVYEFGALPSDTYTFLGASPDGICSQYTLDNTFSTRLGRMLEIKCPVTRDIYIKGKICGEICPFYYYCQVQQQLICCELDACDFWQCKITEYKTKQEYLADSCESCKNYENDTGTLVDIDNKLKKGIILEFYPKQFTPEFDGDNPEWKSKYIIPKRLDMNETQYEAWVIESLDTFKDLYPEINKDYYFYRIIYWKLDVSHNVTIKRDDVFFNRILPILKESWDKIVYYRKNQDKLSELQNIANKRKKYIKMMPLYTIHNDIIIKNKHKILLEDFDHTQLIQPIKKENTFYKKKMETIKDKESDDEIGNNCDFIDDDTQPPINTNNLINKKPTSLTNKTIKHTTFTTTKKVKKLIITTDISNSNDSNDSSNNCDFID
jgi:putative phage-type endonuclease